MDKKVGRNDPCPCGSGKKYKQCCEKLGRTLKFKATLVEKTGKAMPSLFQRAVQESATSSERRLSLPGKNKEDSSEAKEKE